VLLPVLQPAELVRLSNPFDHADFVFELKHDGFRGLAYITTHDGCRLQSRRGNTYKSKSFLPLSKALATLNCAAILDGEIVTLDDDGRPMFYDLLRRRGDPVFYCFDVLWHDGKDLRQLGLLERKRRLEKLVTAHPRILYAQHVEARGCEFFEIVKQRDLEGIVAKRKDAPYGVEWFKIRNAGYSQYEGRRELFERKRSASASGNKGSRLAS
jgi:bifunctional non-homologous end joining protein LigD